MNLDKKSFQNSLIRWFENHGRALPWREDYIPYYIWLSEIMLQQTQMARGVDYFLRWLERFPSVEAVASAEMDEIMKYWEGLGYYARARNLHKAARYMVAHFAGKVPDTVDDLLRLPGVGPYTAAAIASIAFERDVAVVDANVERVYARIFDIDTPLSAATTKKTLRSKAQEMLPQGSARAYNQALMDLGATVCTPKNPDCGICPVASACVAHQGNFMEQRPVKKAEKKIIPIEMATGILMHRGVLFVQQRENDDIWGGLWEFPGGRIEKNETPAEAVVREYMEETGFKVVVDTYITKVVHHYTRYRVTLYGYTCTLDQSSTLPKLTAAQRYHWIKADDLEGYAFPAGHRKLLAHIHDRCPDLFRAVR